MYIFIRTYTCMYIYTFTHIHIKHTCRCMYTYGHNYLILEMVRKANPEPLNVCSLSMPVSEQRKANTQERTKVGEVDGEGEKGEENKREGKEEVNRQGGVFATLPWFHSAHVLLLFVCQPICLYMINYLSNAHYFCVSV